MLHKDNNRLGRGYPCPRDAGATHYRAKEPTELQRPSSKVALVELACVVPDKSLDSTEATVEF